MRSKDRPASGRIAGVRACFQAPAAVCGHEQTILTDAATGVQGKLGVESTLAQSPGKSLKTAFLIVTLSSMLTACAGMAPASRPAAGAAAAPAARTATTPRAPAHPSLASGKPAHTSSRDGSESMAASGDTLPSVELTDELMYKLLSAEIAFQRGDWQQAYQTELSAAQQTRDPRLARRAVEIALAAKQADEAFSAVRLWRELAPQSPEATQYYLGFVLLGDNLDEAGQILTKRLADARTPTLPLMILQTQRLLATVKNREAAFALLDTLLTPYQDVPETHIALAQNAFLRGDGTRALSEARRALTMQPASEMALLTLVQVTPDRTVAEKIMTDYLSSYPASTDVRTAYARTLVEQKQFDKAQAQFEKLLLAQPDNLTSLYALGMLAVQTSQLPQAEQYLLSYLKALAASPDEDRDPGQALLILAQIAQDRGDTDGALKWLAQIDSGEHLFEAQLKRAQLVAKRGNLAQGRHMLQEMKPEGEHEQIQVILAEAQLLREANQADGALHLLGDALKRFPDNTDLLYDYAMMAEKINNLTIMEQALRRVIALTPANQNAYNALGYSFAERNMRLPEAYALVEKALSLAPDDPFIMDSMGWVEFRLGKLKEAEDLLRRAYAARADVEIAVHLGEVLWVKGQKADAQKYWRDASTKDPKNDTLKSTLTRLRVSL